jgi:hypothetical protein
MSATFYLHTNAGQRDNRATGVRNLNASKRKLRAQAQAEAIEADYAKRIDRATAQREARRAKRRK